MKDEKNSDSSRAKDIREMFEPLGSGRKNGRRPRPLTPREKGKIPKISRRKNPGNGVSVGL